MKRGADLARSVHGLFIVHHNKPLLRVETHRHEGDHLLFPLSGSIRVHGAKGWSATVTPGEMAFVPSGLSHAFESADRQKGERLIVILEDECRHREPGRGDEVPQVLPASQLLKELLFHLLLCPETKPGKVLAQAFRDLLAEQLSAELRASPGLLKTPSDPRIQNALRALEKHLSAPLRMRELARQSGLSERNLSRLFKAELSSTPKAVQVQLRIAASKRLLAQGMSVSDAALEVGFGSLSQFILQFRRETGTLPSDYARRKKP